MLARGAVARLIGKVDGIYNDNLAPPARTAWRVPDVAVSFEAGIIALAVGIALYFAWPVEPDWRFSAVAAALAGAGAWRVSNGWLGMCAALLCGFTWAALHTATIDTHPVTTEQRLQISGHVVAVETGRPMRRLIIAVDDVSPTPRTGRPKRVRVRIGKAVRRIDVGEGIRIDAVIAPLPGPAVPNGYDPARRAYFDGLSGSGFAISAPETYDVILGPWERFNVALARTRVAIAERVMAGAPERTAGLQAALLTGLRGGIPDTQRDALRASGLAHILAISGLHMGMVSFGVFAFASALFALLPNAALMDMRKPAAILAMIGATLYLGLSGASVATQRAYVMVMIAFAAILLDRRALSLRSVAVAALITLALRPEALLSVGFQMSFAAVTALVVVYREWSARRPRQTVNGLRDRVVSFYGSLAGTSVVAGFATGGFAMFHFGRVANYGLLGNLAAMAVFPLVMLCGITALLAMPLGWEALPLWAMSQLLSFMLAVATFVADLPGAVGHVEAGRPLALALYGAGFTAACFATRRSLAVGVVLIAASAVAWWSTPVAQLRVTDDGRVSVLTDGSAYTSNMRADRYGRDQFTRGTGEGEVDWMSYRDTFAACDALGCRFALGPHWVSVVTEASEVLEACERDELVILPDRAAGVVARRTCGDRLYDGPRLRALGGFHGYAGDTLRLAPIRDTRRRRRPWGAG